MDIEETKNAYKRATGQVHEETTTPFYESIDIDQEVIKRWLETKQTTLWSIWSITDEAGRKKASEWFYNEIESLVRFTVSKATVSA